MEQATLASKPAIRAMWSDERRWLPIGRALAAKIVRGNRNKGAHVFREDGQTHIKGWGVHLVIARATA